MGKWGETCRELQLGEFLSHLVISFLAEDSPTNNLVNQYSAVLFSMFFFSTYGILRKISVNGGWWQLQTSYFCLIISSRINCPHFDIRNVLKNMKYLVYLINLRITCNCLVWIALYKEFC